MELTSIEARDSIKPLENDTRRCRRVDGAFKMQSVFETVLSISAFFHGLSRPIELEKRVREGQIQSRIVLDARYQNMGKRNKSL